MKLVAEGGLWTTAHRADAPPAVAVLEVAGAVLAWTVDDLDGPVQATFTDVAAADWLWRVLGEAGHVSVVDALTGRSQQLAPLDVAGVDWLPGTLAPLRRLALGHWLRRWWPASIRAGVADLDSALLDAEIAVLTAAAEEFFTGETFDSDVAGLLEPHRAALAAWLHDGDPRVAGLVEAAAAVGDWADLAEIPAPRRQQNYALAAGDAGPRRSGAIASGTASVSWSAVPPGVFDAAEDTVAWTVAADSAGRVSASLEVAVLSPATDIAVRFGEAEGVLDAQGRATLALPMAESAAWNHDWSVTEVAVGGHGDPAETPAVRDRIRGFVRSRLTVTPADAYLAEVLAAESDY